MRKAMKVLADKFRAEQESEGRVFSAGKNPAKFHRWFQMQLFVLAHGDNRTRSQEIVWRLRRSVEHDEDEEADDV